LGPQCDGGFAVDRGFTIAFDIKGLLKGGDDQIACVTAPIVVGRRFTVKRVLMSLVPRGTLTSTAQGVSPSSIDCRASSTGSFAQACEPRGRCLQDLIAHDPELRRLEAHLLLGRPIPLPLLPQASRLAVRFRPRALVTLRSVSAAQAIFSAIEVIAAHCESCAASLLHHPARPAPALPGRTSSSPHGPIHSRSGAFGKPGTVHAGRSTVSARLADELRRISSQSTSQQKNEHDEQNETQPTARVVSHPELYGQVGSAPTSIRMSKMTRIVPILIWASLVLRFDASESGMQHFKPQGTHSRLDGQRKHGRAQLGWSGEPRVFARPAKSYCTFNDMPPSFAGLSPGVSGSEYLHRRIWWCHLFQALQEASQPQIGLPTLPRLPHLVSPPRSSSPAAKATGDRRR
jgi:hypothetical protein